MDFKNALLGEDDEPNVDDPQKQEPENLSETVEQGRAIAEKAGYVWQGLYNGDEDGSVYRLSKPTRGMQPEQLYLSDVVVSPTNDAIGRNATFEWYVEPGKATGNTIESLSQFLNPAPPTQVEDDASWQQEYVTSWVKRMTTFLRGKGELNFGEVMHDGGHDAGVDFMSDTLHDARCPDDIIPYVMEQLKEAFAEELSYEPEQEEVTDVPVNALTSEEIEEVKEAALRTWDAIGPDVLRARQQEAALRTGPTAPGGLRSPRRSALNGSEVAEAVLDAHHIVSHGGLSNELYQKLLGMPRDQKAGLMNQIFPNNAKYGE